MRPSESLFLANVCVCVCVCVCVGGQPGVLHLQQRGGREAGAHGGVSAGDSLPSGTRHEESH